MSFFSRRPPLVAHATTPPLTREESVEQYTEIIARLQESGRDFNGSYVHVCGVGMMDIIVEDSRITLIDRIRAT